MSQAALALYFEAIQWLPLGRWNYQPEDVGSSPFSNLPLLTLAQQHQLTPRATLLVLVALLPFLSFLFAYAMKLRWLMWLQLVPYSLWAAIELGWWVRYAVGYTDVQADRYQRVFGQATQVLPAWGRHLPPDGAHFVLHILIACALVTTAVGLMKQNVDRGKAATAN
jgi:hypothetical protein